MPEQILTQCTVGGAVFVHVKDGVITRIRPIVFDENDPPTWTIEAGGRKFSPFRKVALNPYVVTERSRIYSEKRIKYPYKREDFEPEGTRNPRNRGKSGYERISWDEALDIVAGEMKRIRATYGPAAITGSTSSHHNWGLLFYKMGPFGRFFQQLGYTTLFDNCDSWEGWLWGAVHAWGYYWKLGVTDNVDMLQDALKNTEMVVFWANDPNTTAGNYCGQESVIWRMWLRDLGIKMVFIDPWCNYTAATLGDKWLAPRPGTDAAMAEAIAYVWIKEGTYDKWFIENRTIGFDEFKKQVLGEKDGTPRTPGWAAEITGVPARDITALAREWASKRTMLGCGAMYGVGGACRQAYSTEWTRLMVFLIAMQGLGKPGVNVWGSASMGPPVDLSFQFPGYSSVGWDTFGLVAEKQAVNRITQRDYRLLLPESVMNPPVSWLGEGFCGESIEQQFKPYICPEPGPDGSDIKMLYRHGGSYISTMTDTNRFVEMYQSPNLEFAVNQDCWWQSETSFADIVLPACTNFERSDISEWAAPGGYGASAIGHNHRIIVYQKKCIKPLWESRSDYEIYTDLAERLGFKEEYTEGNSEEDWIKKIFNASSMPQHMSYEDFKKKGYYVVPPPGDDYQPTVSNRWYYEGRPCDIPDPTNPRFGKKGMGTYSGKIEFVSQSLTQHFPDDEERPPLARYIPSWEGYESELAKKYPLQLVSSHLRFSFHTHHENKSPWLDEIPANRIIKDGYAWWPIRLNPSDAEARGIRHGDIVRMYNNRGAVLGIAQITERVRPGVIHSFQASGKYDPLEPGQAGSIDKGGCVNLLTPARMISRNVPGMASNSCLVEIARWEGQA